MMMGGNPFLGVWRIVQMDVWDQDYVNLVVPGHFTFEQDNQGKFQFGTVRGWLDCRLVRAGDAERIEFSWQGHSDTDEACGRGWAVIKDGGLHGHIFIHCSDDSAFGAIQLGTHGGS